VLLDVAQVARSRTPQRLSGSIEMIETVRRLSWSKSMVHELESFFTVWKQTHQALKR
jgi:hypothetical protein